MKVRIKGRDGEGSARETHLGRTLFKQRPLCQHCKMPSIFSTSFILLANALFPDQSISFEIHNILSSGASFSKCPSSVIANFISKEQLFLKFHVRWRWRQNTCLAVIKLTTLRADQRSSLIMCTSFFFFFCFYVYLFLVYFCISWLTVFEGKRRILTKKEK